MADTLPWQVTIGGSQNGRSSCINDQQVENLVSFEENLRLIQQAFGDYSLGQSHVFPVVREEIPRHKGISASSQVIWKRRRRWDLKLAAFGRIITSRD